MKVKLPIGAGICIQGPTDYAQVCHSWNRFDCPIVWSTWDTEPARNILEIERSGIEVVLSPKPEYSGYLNSNLHWVSTKAGLTRLAELGATHVLKSRGDTEFNRLELVWPEIVGCDIAFMHSYNPATYREVSYYLDGAYHNGADFPLDHAVFGQIDTMLHVFGGYSAWHMPVPAEALLLKRWLDYRGWNHDFRPEYLKSVGLIYWGPIAMKHVANFIWLKCNLDMMACMWNEPNIRIY